MIKYDKLEEVNNDFDVNTILVEGEQLLWQGKPSKSVFIINKIFENIIIIIIWCIIDSIFIYAVLNSGLNIKGMLFILAFLAFHLMPVWKWLAGIITASKRWENTNYCLTNKRIIINSGFIGMTYKSIYYTQVNNVDLRIGIIDKIFKVGDITINAELGTVYFLDIKDSQKVYGNIQKIIADMQTDIIYPNALRPDVNPGYNTKYEPK